MSVDAPEAAASEQDHVEANVRRLAELHAQHAGNVTPLQRVVITLTGLLGRSLTVTGVIALVLGWAAYNASAARLGWRAPDPPPFVWLETAATVSAFVATLLILATQRREEQLARHRAQLTLHLVSLSEHKIAKLIELVEAQRRENPLLPTHPDEEAEAMARAVDPGMVLDRIIDTHPEDKVD